MRRYARSIVSSYEGILGYQNVYVAQNQVVVPAAAVAVLEWLRKEERVYMVAQMATHQEAPIHIQLTILFSLRMELVWVPTV
ncbi:hypothetical protein NQ314_001479 [Rhamnusium bicolor]|uniref:Uncharacterized protein n=1 Tax=Rhamnusium bicolor TaxID=1586634 RepID=A0AAV8ZS68_9CUCU|nr:hypothetical protein NQ314_001479 [Rhamnusium bicolor]